MVPFVTNYKAPKSYHYCVRRHILVIFQVQLRKKDKRGGGCLVSDSVK